MDNSEGAFRDSWDAYREKWSARQRGSAALPWTPRCRATIWTYPAGRLIAFPWRLGELDNTLVSVMSGDGAEGRVSDETETEGDHDDDSQEAWHAGIWPG